MVGQKINSKILFLNLFEIVIIEILSILSFKKLDIMNKFFSTPPPSIEGEKIISFFCFIILYIFHLYKPNLIKKQKTYAI